MRVGDFLKINIASAIFIFLSLCMAAPEMALGETDIQSGDKQGAGSELEQNIEEAAPQAGPTTERGGPPGITPI